jgi:hypothetical protein
MGRGVFATGKINFVQSEDVSDSVQVGVTARFRRQEHLDAAKACLLTGGEGEQSGVGLFVRPICCPRTFRR